MILSNLIRDALIMKVLFNFMYFFMEGIKIMRCALF